MSEPSPARLRILVVAEKYLPGWKAGGPIRSLSNMVDQLGDEFEFWIVTGDRDRGDSEPYAGIDLDTWVPVGKARVFYGRRGSLRYGGLARIIAEAEPDLVYLNSLMSRLTMRHLVHRRLRFRSAPPVLISPRGELDPGALSIKPIRKRIYLAVGRLLGLFTGVTWQATTPLEASYIADTFTTPRVRIATNLVEVPPPAPAPPMPKQPGTVNLAFISRVGPKKNLPYLLRALRSVKGSVTLQVHGRKVSAEWETVESLLRTGLDHVEFSYRGATNHEDVDEALRQSHFFVLPTLGESFGHAIYEALRLGRPVLISDTTPWRDLAEAGAGWDIPLDDATAWRDALQTCVDMEADTYLQWSIGAHAAAAGWYEDSEQAAAQAAAFKAAAAATSESTP